MLNLNGITFRDDKTGNIISVSTDGNVTSEQNISPDDYATACFYAGLLFAGGYTALSNFINKDKV